MEPTSDRRHRLERFAGRATRSPFGRARRRPPGRAVVAGAVIVVLGAAVLVMSRSPRSAAPSPPQITVTTSSAPPLVPSTMRPSRRVLDGVAVTVYAPGADIADAYGRVAGLARPGTGPPKCARGLPDERSWSRPPSPDRPAGRYRCRLEDGHAAMWWSDADTGLLVHAVATDADLAALFRWWRAHPGV